MQHSVDAGLTAAPPSLCSVSLPPHLPPCLPPYLPACLPAYLPISLPACLPLPPPHTPTHPQEDLLAEATEGRLDESRRASLHARWADVQEAKEIRELLNAIKNGFRRKRRLGAGLEGDGDEVRQGWRAGGRAA